MSNVARYPMYPNMQKHRVSRACDTCKRRKIRCTGKQPCAHCIRNNKTCEFKAAYTRGAVPEVQSAPVAEQEKYLEEVGYKRRQVWRPSTTRRNSNPVQHPEQESEDEPGEDQDMEDNERTGTDSNAPLPKLTLSTSHPRELSSRISSSQGQHHLSSTHQIETNINNLSCVSVYERTQDKINRREYHQKNPVSAYGDPPFPEIDTSILIFPSENTAQALVRKYFDFVAATNRILHQPTVETWTRELLSNVRGMRNGAEKNSQRAVALMVLASAHEYMGDECGEWDANISFYYFQAAETQLAKETGEIRLATLQARLLQCLYLLSRSRINQCYSIFGTVVNFIYALGINKERRPSNTSDLLEIEIQKRVFWSAYIIDKYLGSALGRPQMLRDEDVDQPLPFLVEDDNLSSDSLQTTKNNAQNPMKGAVFQIKLAKILSNILHEFYSIKKNSLETQLASAENLNVALLTWRSEIGHFLDIDPSLLSPLYGRQNMVLRLSYSQALIILYRPFLVDSFDNHLPINVPGLREKLEDNVSRCLDAALDIAKTIDAMHKMEMAFNASWFAHYCGYTANVALFVHTIKRCISYATQVSSINPNSGNTSDPLKWILHFDTATKCQEQIKNSSISTEENFAQKCSVVLEELRAEAMVAIRQIKNKETNGWERSEEERRPASLMEEASDGLRSEIPLLEMEETNFFGGECNDVNVAPECEALFSVFNGLDGIRVPSGSSSLVDRIDRWGFSSLTGY